MGAKKGHLVASTFNVALLASLTPCETYCLIYNKMHISAYLFLLILNRRIRNMMMMKMINPTFGAKIIFFRFK